MEEDERSVGEASNASIAALMESCCANCGCTYAEHSNGEQCTKCECDHFENFTPNERIRFLGA